jgi:hypothetical protein
MAEWTAVSRAGDPRPAQDAPHARAAQRDRLSLGEELREMAVVEPPVPRRDEPDDPLPDVVGDALGGRPPAVAVHEVGRAVTLEAVPCAVPPTTSRAARPSPASSSCAAALIWIFGQINFRFILEIFMVLFRINDSLSEINERGKKMQRR